LPCPSPPCPSLRYLVPSTASLRWQEQAFLTIGLSGNCVGLTLPSPSQPATPLSTKPRLAWIRLLASTAGGSEASVSAQPWKPCRVSPSLPALSSGRLPGSRKTCCFVLASPYADGKSRRPHL
jgi:hypothetical protein